MTIAALRRIASLQSVTEAETAFGGRTRSWTEIATLWVDLKPSSAAGDAVAGQRPVLVETAQAEARDHALAEVGQRLTIGADNWRVIRLVRHDPAPGRMTLFLERDPT